MLTPSPLVPRTIYAATSFDKVHKGENSELCNDGTTGTALNLLAVYNGASPACAVKAAIEHGWSVGNREQWIRNEWECGDHVSRICSLLV